MRAVSCLIFVALLFSNSSAASNWLKGLKDVAKHLDQQKSGLQTNPNNTHLGNINMDCTLSIFEEFDFESLVNMAETNKDVATCAAEIFRRKFSTKTIVIEDYFENVVVPTRKPGLFFKKGILFRKPEQPNEAINRIAFTDSDNEVKIHDVRLVVSTMRNFGSLIQRIKVVYNNASTVQSQKVTKFINKYCADTLVELELNNAAEQVFKFMPNPFKNLEHIIFSHLFTVYYWDVILPMNEQFPKLQRASFILSEWGGSYPYTHLPHLEHLKWHVNSLRVNHIFDMAIANPQIRTIDLSEIRETDLKTVNRYLINLESITISEFPFRCDPLHFDKVTKLNVEDHDFYPSIFTFSNLQEVSMNCYDEECERWIDHLEQLKNVNRFNIGYSNMNDDQFERLMNLPNLNELTIARLQGEPLKINTITRFMESHEKLQKFSLGTCQESDKANLREIFQNGWEITDYNTCLSFERKN